MFNNQPKNTEFENFLIRNKLRFIFVYHFVTYYGIGIVSEFDLLSQTL